MIVFAMHSLTWGLPLLVGQWTFESGNEAKDLTGNWGNLQLYGGASVANGMLNVDSNSTWAVAQAYAGPTIVEKTLISWVSLDNLDVQSGSALTIDRLSSDHFDAIVYGERQTHRWMPGSTGFQRTQDPNPGFAETATNQLVQLAITYQNSGGLAHITMYRNGSLIGDYTYGGIGSWSAGDAEVIFGVRHDYGGGRPGQLDAHIAEARIYAGVLTQTEIQSLSLVTVPEPATMVFFLLGLLGYGAKKTLKNR